MNVSSILTAVMIIASTSLMGLPQGKFTVKVVSEDGSPIEGATVSAGFRDTVGSTGLTNQEGEYSHQSEGWITGISVVEKDGYYMTNSGFYSFGTNEEGDLLDPWNPTFVEVLKKRVEPHGMGVGWFPEQPILDQPIGFDLLVGDFVTPFGKGRITDCLITLKGKLWPYEIGQYRGQNVEISLIMEIEDPAGGFLKYDGWSFLNPKHGGSIMRSPIKAPGIGYESQISLVSYRITDRLTDDGFSIHVDRKDDMPEGTNYMLRFRTEVDQHGRVVKAYYGKIEDLRVEYDPYDPSRWRIGGIYYVNLKPEVQGLEHLVDGEFKKNTFIRPWPEPHGVE